MENQHLQISNNTFKKLGNEIQELKNELKNCLKNNKN